MGESRPKFDPAAFPLVLLVPYPTEVGCYFYLTSLNTTAHSTYQLRDLGAGCRLTEKVGSKRDRRFWLLTAQNELVKLDNIHIERCRLKLAGPV